MYILVSNENCVILGNATFKLCIAFVTESIAKITYTKDKPFKFSHSLIVTNQHCFTDYNFSESPSNFIIETTALKLVVSKEYGAISYFDQNGKRLLQEPERGGKWLTGKTVYNSVVKNSAQSASNNNLDAKRCSMMSRDVFEAKLELVFDENEAIFGFGSHEEGYGNMRGKQCQLYQHSRKIGIPYFVSTLGYGVLLDCCSLITFHDDALGSYLWADVVDELDFYFIYGGKFDSVTRGYHELTGRVPLFPKWAFGYIQSKERYINAKEIVDVVDEYRRRGISLDLIALDWRSWPSGNGWGQKSLDPTRFPDPTSFLNALHKRNVHLMVSVWPSMSDGCANHCEMKKGRFLLDDNSTYNAFVPEARACYWNQTNTGLFVHGVDAWWSDFSEPFIADWAGAVEPEAHNRLIMNIQHFKQYLDPDLINAYSLQHAKAIYDGQRGTTLNKRVFILTRSAYAGQHRYATAVWSGDTCATWETLRRCIPSGFNFCATGEAFWTVDIGGFFINYDKEMWFWRGDYSEGCRGTTDGSLLEPDPQDTGCSDLGFRELYVRWLQYATFLPLFRSHGTDASREVWRFGEVGTPFYDAIVKYIRLRYQLMPYIYSLAAQITLNSYTMLRAIALDFPDDPNTFDLIDQYLFGSALLICPVTKPMYYQRNSIPIRDEPKTRCVYLPLGSRWYDFWTETIHEGGQTNVASASLDTLPIFVREGSIIPMTQVMQYVDEVTDAPYEIRIYRGADARFTIYEDEGDNYNYEQEAFALVSLSWYESCNQLKISSRQGFFSGLVTERQYDIIFISEEGRETKTIIFKGDELLLSSAKPYM
ncbi:unnamed protein product [Rotaria magnacalcarata]|uniref:Uncharacterized protein n=2 Tax=Rotaria magnacalcarata TaxID=392030 RepID=A0A814V6H5_9BILA|nr:unnamed protein product [Rotaria magnacalcarata]CAF2218280.1 unnamed protein product [Rotaria magnacalcarata]CAF3919361.1 unnamed protein product [Rotaria magnacalcarata]CAF4079519.1 unnamed protein product [Rotaria magnacalcarata]